MKNLVWTLSPWRFKLAGAIHRAARRAARSPELRELLVAAGFEPARSAPGPPRTRA